MYGSRAETTYDRYQFYPELKAELEYKRKHEIISAKIYSLKFSNGKRANKHEFEEDFVGTQEQLGNRTSELLNKRGYCRVCGCSGEFSPDIDTAGQNLICDSFDEYPIQKEISWKLKDGLIENNFTEEERKKIAYVLREMYEEELAEKFDLIGE